MVVNFTYFVDKLFVMPKKRKSCDLCESRDLKIIYKNVIDYEEYIKKSGPITSYAIQKVDLKNSYTSHYTLFDVISENTPKIQINAPAISNRGGQLINRDYFANWGSKDDVLQCFETHDFQLSSIAQSLGRHFGDLENAHMDGTDHSGFR